MGAINLSASSAERLINCPGSADLTKSIPGFVYPEVDEEKGAKGLGTLLHDRLAYFTNNAYMRTPEALRIIHSVLYTLADMHHTKRRPIMKDLGEWEQWYLDTNLELRSDLPEFTAAARLAFGEWLHGIVAQPPKILRYMADVAEYLLTTIFSKGSYSSFNVHTEAKVFATWLKRGRATTPDVAIVGPRVLEIIDYKSGVIPVDPVGNYQLMFYAACYLHLAPNAQKITLTILQPGDEGFNSWQATREQIEEFMAQAQEAERRIALGSVVRVAGSHCTFCPANPHGRGDKGKPWCDVKYEQLYPTLLDEEAILGE